MKQRLSVVRAVMVLALGAAPAANVASLDFDKTAPWGKPLHHENEFAGKVELVDIKHDFIVVKSEKGKLDGFYVNAESRIVKEKKVISLGDIKKGDTITLVYHCEDWGNCIATAEILVKRKLIRSTI